MKKCKEMMFCGACCPFPYCIIRGRLSSWHMRRSNRAQPPPPRPRLDPSVLLATVPRSLSDRLIQLAGCGVGQDAPPKCMCLGAPERLNLALCLIVTLQTDFALL